jgi:aarF domain-containing kinase
LEVADLWPEQTQIVLLDFGAARGFADSFLDEYMEVLFAAAKENRAGIVRHSRNLGFLTGAESEVGVRFRAAYCCRANAHHRRRQ